MILATQQAVHQSLTEVVGSYMLEIGIIIGLVASATIGIGAAAKQAGFEAKTVGRLKFWFALLSGPVGAVIVRGLGLLEIGPVSGPWGWAGALFFGLIGSGLAMAGHDVKDVIKRGKKGKLPQ